ITEFPTAGSSPEGISAGPDGNLWFTEFNGNNVGMINPATHAIAEFPVPLASAGPRDTTAGPDGNVWFTEESAGYKIGMINPATHAITEYPVPYANSSSMGIAAGPDGNVWFIDRGTNSIGVDYLYQQNLGVTVQPPASVTAGSGLG